MASLILAIESSCDECAVALLDYDRYQSGETVKGYLVSDFIASQADLHLPYGGVVPELAAREHLTTLPKLLAHAFEDSRTALSEVIEVAATQGPGLKGCLLVGVTFGRALALSLKVPYRAVNHLEAHILSMELLDQKLAFPFLTLLVSGGHTLLVIVRGVGQYEVVAQTRDDAAGEAFDKSATLLELPYPGGPQLSKLAASGRGGCFQLPSGMQSDEHSFSFSGLKTAIARLTQQLKKSGEYSQANCRADVAACVQDAIISQLVSKTEFALKANPVNGVFLTGGVAANSVLRERLEELCLAHGIRFVAPPIRWCTDNAAMIAITAAMRKKHGVALLGSEVEVRPRWPIEDLR